MKLTEAIEIAKAHRTGHATTPAKDHFDSLTLLIEAAKLVEVFRDTHIAGYIALLPGETKE